MIIEVKVVVDGVTLILGLGYRDERDKPCTRYMLPSCSQT